MYHNSHLLTPCHSLMRKLAIRLAAFWLAQPYRYTKVTLRLTAILIHRYANNETPSKCLCSGEGLDKQNCLRLMRGSTQMGFQVQSKSVGRKFTRFPLAHHTLHHCPSLGLAQRRAPHRAPLLCCSYKTASHRPAALPREAAGNFPLMPCGAPRCLSTFHVNMKNSLERRSGALTYPHYCILIMCEPFGPLLTERHTCSGCIVT